MPCSAFRPDHNGECSNCDDWMDAHVCPCRLAVPLDYATRDEKQAAAACKLIDQLGEFTTITIGTRTWKVSRHCIALHGVKAEEIETYGFEELR